MTEPLDDARELDEVLKAFGRATTQTQIDYPQRLEAIMKVEKFLQKLRAAPARGDAVNVGLPKPETMLTYASILEKPQYWIDPKTGAKYLLATGEVIEAACAALRYCAHSSAQYRCTCGAEPYCAPNVHAASCPLAISSTPQNTEAK